MFRDYNDETEDPIFSEVFELDLSTVRACCSGPKRPQDKVAVTDMKTDFTNCLNNKIGFKVNIIYSSYISQTVISRFIGYSKIVI
jgi:aconitate hydratase